MYLVSLFEREGIVEASLGGRVTADEVRVFGEELLELLETFEERSFSLLLDFSRAKRLDHSAVCALGMVKDQCFGAGASEIVSVPCDEHDLVSHQSTRLQFVLEGKERFQMDATRSALTMQKQASIPLAA